MTFRGRREIWFVLLVVSMFVLLAIQPLLAEEAKQEVTVWYIHGADQGKFFAESVEKLYAKYPQINVKLTYMPYSCIGGVGSGTMPKLLMSVAAGNPPDLATVWNVWSWAHFGGTQPLDDYYEASGITEDTFWPQLWRDMNYKGHIWGVPQYGDAAFLLFYNKELLRDAGLDAENFAPKTFEEFDIAADKLTKYDSAENIDQIGFIPWRWSANILFPLSRQLGEAREDPFYDYENQKVTADDPAIVEVVEWMVSYAKKYDPVKVSAAKTAAGGTELDGPFWAGKLAMMYSARASVGDIERHAPDLELGVTFAPGPRSFAHQTTSWAMVMPRGAKNPDGAWKFLEYLASPEGADHSYGMGMLPSRPGLEYDPRFHKTEFDEAFWTLINHTEDAFDYPQMAVIEQYYSELSGAIDKAIYFKETPEEALKHVREVVQKALDAVL